MALAEPMPPDPACRRFASAPFPPYRYVPTLNPHPCAHPQGHSYEPPGHPRHAPPPLLPPDRWRECDGWLFGVDLYNYAYWWETHETWEAIWQQSDKRGVQGRFLQGLIQIAAAHLKRHMGEREGMQRLLERAAAHLDFVEAELRSPWPAGARPTADAGAAAFAPYMGLDLREFRTRCARYFAGPGRDGYPFIELQLA